MSFKAGKRRRPRPARPGRLRHVADLERPELDGPGRVDALQRLERGRRRLAPPRPRGGRASLRLEPVLSLAEPAGTDAHEWRFTAASLPSAPAAAASFGPAAALDASGSAAAHAADQFLTEFAVEATRLPHPGPGPGPDPGADSRLRFAPRVAGAYQHLLLEGKREAAVAAFGIHDIAPFQAVRFQLVGEKFFHAPGSASLVAEGKLLCCKGEDA